MLEVNSGVKSIASDIENMSKIHVGETEPSNPKKGDIWFDTNKKT